jgi:hypothetical protein
MDRSAMERIMAQLPAASGEEALFFEMCRSALRAELALCEEK